MSRYAFCGRPPGIAMRVLITRAQPDADAFAELCRARKLVPIVCPLMELEIAEAEIALTDVGALAFTSANGVRAFAKHTPGRHLPAFTLPVFTVGDASARVACALGFENVHAAGGDVDALAGMIVEHKAGLDGEVLHIAGTHRAGDLVSALSHNGVNARRQVLYQMRDAAALPSGAISALTAHPPVDWVVLFSPRSAELFLTLSTQAGLIDALAQIRVACLSDAVAQKADIIRWKSVEIAAGRNVAAMIELLASANPN